MSTQPTITKLTPHVPVTYMRRPASADNPDGPTHILKGPFGELRGRSRTELLERARSLLAAVEGNAPRRES